MKFDCGETWEEWRARKEQWHPFFTIWPRKVGPHDCRWLETIERRYCLMVSWKEWEYRPAQLKGLLP